MARFPGRPERGFTLIELMVVVAIVAILATVAVVGVSRTGQSRGVEGASADLVSLAETARMRSVARKRWQQLEYLPGENAIVHWEADYQGMRLPGSTDNFLLVRQLNLPTEIEVSSLVDQAHDTAPTGVGAGTFSTDGAPYPRVVHFRPDGSIDGDGNPGNPDITGATFFLRDTSTDKEMRVVVFSATGVAYALDGW